jgi:Tol biopolymer transport system component
MSESISLLVGFLISLLALVGCSSDPSPEKTSAEAPKSYAPPTGPKIPADGARIQQMLNEKFGRDARAVRVEVESDESGVRVRLRGEVPSDLAKEAIIREVAERVEGLRIQDFDLTVSGPVSMIGIVEADFSEEGAIFTPDLHYAATFDESASHCPAIYDLWAGVRINRLNIDKMPHIQSIAFSPDGKTLASGHQNSQMVFWNMPLGHDFKIFEKARDITTYNFIAAMAFSPDGKYLASIQSQKGEVWLWGLEGSREARLLGTQTPNQQYLLAFSPDGKLLASADNQDNHINVWDVSKRALSRKLEGPSMYLEALAFSPDSKTLAAGRSNQEPGLVLWDVASGKSRNLTTSKTGSIKDICFSPDGKTLASRHDNSMVILWDMESGKEWQSLDAARVGYGRGMAFSPDGSVLALVCKQTSPASSGPSAFQFWDVSQRPGAAPARIEFPPKKSAPPEIRDDMLAQQIANRILGTFGKRIVKEISVEVLTDGSVRLVGKVNSPHVKESAERTVTASFPIQGKHGFTKRKVINQLEVVGY